MSPAPDTAAGGSAGWAGQAGLQPGAPAPAKGPEGRSSDWLALALTAKVTAEGASTPAARVEGRTARLQGALVVAAAQEFAGGVNFATLPEGCRPAADVTFIAALTMVGGVVKPVRLTLKAAGGVEVSQLVAALKEGNQIWLDGITYPLV